MPKKLPGINKESSEEFFTGLPSYMVGGAKTTKKTAPKRRTKNSKAALPAVGKTKVKEYFKGMPDYMKGGATGRRKPGRPRKGSLPEVGKNTGSNKASNYFDMPDAFTGGRDRWLNEVRKVHAMNGGTWSDALKQASALRCTKNGGYQTVKQRKMRGGGAMPVSKLTLGGAKKILRNYYKNMTQ